MDPRDLEKALAEIPARGAEPTAGTPDLAERLRPPPRPRSRLRLVAFALALAVGLAAGIGGAWLLYRRMKPPPRRFEHATEIDRSHYLPPIKTERDAAGEETAPFTGFAVSIETVPTGAVVSIGGVVRGEAPVLANIDCRGTERVEIRAQKAGRSARRELTCRADTLVKLTLRLEP